MIFVINICRENLHYFEFVKPICDILEKNNIKYFVKNYKDADKKDFNMCSKVIICGTSLFDNEFAERSDKFKWINNFGKPVLGICGGMQIIGLVFGGKLRKMTEIGFYSEYFNKEFLGMKGKYKVYHLHNNYIDFSNIPDFEIYSGKEFSQAAKHIKKEIYGVLFHPEVREKGLIEEFCSL